ncbi:MAG: septation protein A [Betaproteobacteria bacterium]|nr:MAG: septation protein A [Betaproteobacteria bacterium]
MKFLFDIFPVLLFFAAYKAADIYIATAVAIAATFAQIGWVWFRHRKVENMLWVSLVIIVVFGGATLLLRDETFIKWKPTVLYWLFGATLLIAELGFGKNLIRAMMGSQIELPGPVWSKLNWSWVGFFAVMGVLNLYVAYNYSTDTWVDFKLFGGTGLMLVFVLIQAFTLAKHVEDKGPG